MGGNFLDISIPMGEGRFNFRVAVVLMDQGRVLLHKNEYDDHWALPGGRVTMYETMEETAVREIKEELDINIKIVKMLWFTENFFRFEGESFHEIGSYYQAELCDVNSCYRGNLPFEGWEGDRVLIYQWFPVSRLQEIELYPSFLREGLQMLPDEPQFIVINDLK